MLFPAVLVYQMFSPNAAAFHDPTRWDIRAPTEKNRTGGFACLRLLTTNCVYLALLHAIF